MLRSRGLLVDYVGELEVVLLENNDDLVGYVVGHSKYGSASAVAMTYLARRKTK